MTVTVEARQILERMREVYATCSSYRDEGEVESVMIMGPRRFDQETTIKPFATAFVRPNSFRYEFWKQGHGPREEWDYAIVWTEGKKYRSWWTLQSGRRGSHSTIPRAVAGFVGVSGSSAYTVPNLLVTSGSLAPRQGLKSRGRADLDGIDCWVIDMGDGEETLWIDVSTGLIRLIEEFHDIRPPKSVKTVFGHVWQRILGLRPTSVTPVRWENRTRYRPELDPDIPSDHFAFDPDAVL